jgi:hypothetical protein
VQSAALVVREVVTLVVCDESTTVPSGRVVGSSRTSRPFSTRARRGLIGLPYDFSGGSASARPPSGPRVVKTFGDVSNRCSTVANPRANRQFDSD